MQSEHDGYVLSDDIERVDFAKVTEWLSGSYWSPGIGRKEVERGIGRALVRFAMEHPEYAPVYLWLLATNDAHGVYAKLGFGPHPHPERMMVLLKPWPRDLP